MKSGEVSPNCRPPGQQYQYARFSECGAGRRRSTIEGSLVGRGHIRMLMRRMGIRGVYRRPHASARHPAHPVYPYLLGGLTIDRPNQVWAADITYIPMAKGFVFLVAIMDWAMRKVLAWRISPTLTTDFCVAALEDALDRFGAPEIFNTDQGAIHERPLPQCLAPARNSDQHGRTRLLA